MRPVKTDRKMPKWHELLFADMPLAGRLFVFVVFSILGVTGLFFAENSLGPGIVFLVLAGLFGILFFRRHRFLRDLFQNGIRVDAIIRERRILFMQRQCTTYWVFYSYTFAGEEHTASCITPIDESYAPMATNSTVKILVLPRYPSRPVVQELFVHSSLFFAFIVYLFTGRTGKEKAGKDGKRER